MALVIACALAACRSTPTADAAAPDRVFDGTWEGSLRAGKLSNEGAGWEWGEQSMVRIVIQGASVEVDAQDDDKSWRRIDKPFHIRSHRTNAVITAINDGRDRDDEWVETWTLLLSQVNWRTLNVTWNRQVNNEDTPRQDPNAVWWQFAYGTLELQGVAP